MDRASVTGGRVFISYSRVDDAHVEWLRTRLGERGVPVWIDQRNIPPGKRWDRVVQEALDDCRQLVVVLTHASTQSDNVLDEVSYALSRGDLVIPLLFEPCDVPFRLQRLQWIDFTRDREPALDQLCTRLLARPSLPSSEQALDSIAPPKGSVTQSGPSARRHSRSVAVWSGLVLALAAVGGAWSWIGTPAVIEPPRAGLEALELFYGEDSKVQQRDTEGEWTRAVASFEQALMQRDIAAPDRQHWEAALEFSRARLAELAGDRARAEAAAKVAIEREPGWALPHLLMATVLTDAGRFEEALKHATEAERDERLWRAIVMRGGILAAEGEPYKAIAELQRARLKAPDAPSVLSALALAYHFAGTQDAQARELAERALKLDAGQLPAYIVLIEQALERGMVAEALVRSVEMMAAARDRVAAWLARGDALQASDDLGQATLAWKHALQLRAEHGDENASPVRLDEVANALAKGEVPPPRFPHPRVERATPSAQTPVARRASSHESSDGSRTRPSVRRKPVLKPASSRRTSPSDDPLAGLDDL